MPTKGEKGVEGEISFIVFVGLQSLKVTDNFFSSSDSKIYVVEILGNWETVTLRVILMIQS